MTMMRMTMMRMMMMRTMMMMMMMRMLTTMMMMVMMMMMMRRMMMRMRMMMMMRMMMIFVHFPLNSVLFLPVSVQMFFSEYFSLSQKFRYFHKFRPFSEIPSKGQKS